MTPTPSAGQPASPVPARVRKHSRLFTASLLGALVATYLPYPWHLAVAPLAITATIFATLALWHTAGEPRMGTLRIMLGVGALMAAFLVLLGAGLALAAPESQRLQECLGSSLTPEGDVRCQNAYEDALEDRYGFSAG